GATSESSPPIGSSTPSRMAGGSGPDLASPPGSGPGRGNIKRGNGGAPRPPKTSPAPAAFPRAVERGRFPQAAASGYRDEPASEIRKTIAKRLVTTLGPVPHFFLTTEIEMERAAEMRRGIDARDPELKISIDH